MTAYALTAAGERWQLPPSLVWEIEYTSGIPCDSFLYRCPCAGEGGADPASWYRVELYEGQKLVFRGVVDECVQTVSDGGQLLELSGRGMAALLLDNEALGQDYGTATQADILRDHVTPYGIRTAPGADLPPVSQFSVATGSSEWSVVYEFARYHGGVAPRFDRQGRLVLTGWTDAEERLVGDGAPVTRMCCRDKRYGVLSQVLVRDRFSGAVQTVENKTFLADGGRARRVLTMPGRSNYKAMRYSGQFQLDRSAAELERLEVTVAQPFGAWPGDLLRIQRSNWDRCGLYRAVRTVAGMDGRGYWTRLELAPPDLVL